MRVYRRYRCDYGHEWTLIRQKGEPEMEGETRCPEGHEAITCNEEPPADEVQILLRPASRIVDNVTGQIWGSGRYYLVLFDRSDTELCVSMEHYSWDEVVELASLFKSKSVTRALEWWKRKSP